jgi:hypothetical protein
MSGKKILIININVDCRDSYLNEENNLQPLE